MNKESKADQTDRCIISLNEYSEGPPTFSKNPF